MKHEYTSYAIPAPTIKDRNGALEDARGGLGTTHDLLDILICKIESLQDLVSKSNGGLNEAIALYLGQTWSQAQAISDRIKNDIILIDAIVDSQV